MRGRRPSVEERGGTPCRPIQDLPRRVGTGKSEPVEELLTVHPIHLRHVVPDLCLLMVGVRPGQPTVTRSIPVESHGIAVHAVGRTHARYRGSRRAYLGGP